MSKIARDLNIKNIEERVFELEKNPGGGISEVPLATDEAVGGFKTGNGVSLNEDGTLNIPETYNLPKATYETLGGIKVGEGLGNTSCTKLGVDDHLQLYITPETGEPNKAIIPMFLGSTFPYKKDTDIGVVGEIYREEPDRGVTGGLFKRVSIEASDGYKVNFNRPIESMTLIIDKNDSNGLRFDPIKDATNRKITYDLSKYPMGNLIPKIGKGDRTNYILPESVYLKGSQSYGYRTGYISPDNTKIKMKIFPFKDTSLPAAFNSGDFTTEIIFCNLDFNSTQKTLNAKGFMIDKILNMSLNVNYSSVLSSSPFIQIPIKYSNSIYNKVVDGVIYGSLGIEKSTYTDSETSDVHEVYEQKIRIITNFGDFEDIFNHSTLKNSEYIYLEFDGKFSESLANPGQRYISDFSKQS